MKVEEKNNYIMTLSTSLFSIRDVVMVIEEPVSVVK